MWEELKCEASAICLKGICSLFLPCGCKWKEMAGVILEITGRGGFLKLPVGSLLMCIFECTLESLGKLPKCRSISASSTRFSPNQFPLGSRKHCCGYAIVAVVTNFPLLLAEPSTVNGDSLNRLSDHPFPWLGQYLCLQAEDSTVLCQYDHLKSNTSTCSAYRG